MSWARSDERHARLSRRGAGPWTRDQLLSLGWSSRQVERDLSAGRLVRVRRGLYVGADVEVDWSLPASYAPFVGAAPGPVVSHESAARVVGLWLAPDADERVHLTTEQRPLPSDHAVRRHRAALPAADVELRDGVPFTTPTRTAVDLALGRRLPDALRALDCVLRQLALGEAWNTHAGRTLLSAPSGAQRQARALEALSATAGRAAGRNGSQLLRSALPWVDARSESPYESWSRGVLIGAGLVPEVLGLAVTGASGKVHYADMAWPSLRVLVEVDGLSKYGTDARAVRERLAAERRRQADLEDAGWLVVRWTAGEGADVIVARVRRALASAA